MVCCPSGNFYAVKSSSINLRANYAMMRAYSWRTSGVVGAGVLGKGVVMVLEA
jgi:hypothetical protein